MLSKERTESDSLSYQDEYVTKSRIKRYGYNLKEFSDACIGRYPKTDATQDARKLRSS